MKPFILKHKEFFIIFFLSQVLRFLPLFGYQLTYDEFSGLERTQFDSFSELIEKGVKIDAHPALVQLLIFYTVKLFGYQTWLIKLPFLLFGSMAIVYGYLLGLRHFSKQVGLIMTVFLSFSLVFVFYAPIARMYISGVFFSLALLFYFFELLVAHRRSTKNYTLFGLFALLSAFNHHLNALFAMSLYFSGFLLLQKKEVKPYLLMALVILLTYLPHLKVSLYQLGVGGIGRDQGGWLEKPEAMEILNFIKLFLGTGATGWILMLVILANCFIKKNYSLDKIQWILLSIFLFNYLVIYFYSVFRAPIYQHSMLLFSGMAFLLLVASLLESPVKATEGTLVYGLLVLLGYRTYIQKDYFSQAVKTVFEYQFERTIQYKKQFGKENVYAVFFDADNIMKRVCFEKYGMSFDCKASIDSETIELRKFSEFVQTLNCNYLALSSSMPAFQAVAKNHFPYLLENTQTQGVHYKLYSKLPSDSVSVVPDDEVLNYSEPKNAGSFVYTKSLHPTEGFMLDSLIEYPFDAYAPYKNVVMIEGNMILLTATFNYSAKRPQQLEACINIGDTSTKELYGYAAKPASDFIPGKDSTVTIYTDYFAGTTHKRALARAKIGCYLWNRGREEAKLMNFNIRVVNHWQQKWHFWD